MTRKREVHLPLDQVSKNICQILQSVYKDDTRNSFKRGAKELFDLYKQEQTLDVNKDEFVADLGYRVKMFISALNDADGQLRLLKTLGLFAGKVLIELDDDSIVETLVIAVHEKKYESMNSRCNAATLIGRLYLATLKNLDDEESSSWPSYLGEDVFSDLYGILISLSSDMESQVRMSVVIALKYICKFPQLMTAVKTERYFHSNHLMLVGTKDPDEMVRKCSISHLPINDQIHARFILECLLNDTSAVVKKAAAKRIITELPYHEFTQKDIWNVFRNKQLFLDDKIVPEYYDILLAWSEDVYRSKHADAGDKLTNAQICEGTMHFLAGIMYSKEWHQVYKRLFEHMRRKFFPRDETEESFIQFTRSFCDLDDVFINANNYMDFVKLDLDNTSLNILNLKLRKSFMWLALCEYCLHLSIGEVTRIECRTILLPTMVEMVNFMTLAINTIRREGDCAAQDAKGNARKVLDLQLATLKCLLRIIPFLDKDDPGMVEWKHLLVDLLTNTDVGIQLDQDIYYLIVYQLIYYHFDLKDSISLDRAVHEISDICYSIVGTGQMLSSQDLFNATQLTNMTQFSVSMFNETQQAAHAREDPPIDMSQDQMSRCVNILAAVVKTGFFLKPNTVFDGLILNFGVRSFDTALDLEIKRMAFLCIAGMATVTDQNERNYIRYARAVIDNENETPDIKKVALMMLSDAIQVYGYDRVVELYFQDMHGETGVGKYSIVAKLIELAEDETTSKILTSFIIRIMLRLIIFDYKKIFKDCASYLLKRLFRKNQEDRATAPMLFSFFVNYVSVSRDHQVIFATTAVEALMSLLNCDLDSPDAQIEQNLMADYILALTAFNTLKPQAVGREEGTAQIMLARQLIIRIDSIEESDKFAELIGRMISQCEVTEVSDPTLVVNMKKACKRFVLHSASPKLKRLVEGYFKRLEMMDRHLTSKRNKAREPPVQLTLVELEREMQNIVNQLKLTDEETNIDKVSWITDDFVPEMENLAPKMKIWGEKTYDLEKMMSETLVQEIVSPKNIPKVAKRTAVKTPKGQASKRTVQQTPKRAVGKLLPAKRKLLPTVPEDEIEIVDLD